MAPSIGGLAARSRLVRASRFGDPPIDASEVASGGASEGGREGSGDDDWTEVGSGVLQEYDPATFVAL